MSTKKARWYKRFWTFLKDVRAELKKVTWPSRNEVIKHDHRRHHRRSSSSASSSSSWTSSSPGRISKIKDLFG